MSSLIKVSMVGLALTLIATPALAQVGPARAGAPASYTAIPRTKIRLGTPTLPIRPGMRPWISEARAAPQPNRGPLLPEPVQPAVSKLDADKPPAPAGDVIVLPVTTILIVLLVVVIVLAVD